MADYQKMYAILCGAVDDALMGLEQGSSAACIALRLRLALERAEEIYLETSMCAERRGDTNLIDASFVCFRTSGAETASLRHLGQIRN